MQFTHLLLSLPLLSTLSLASSGVAPPAVTCHQTTTFSAVFDHLPTASPVPNNLGGVNWTGFTVTPKNVTFLGTRSYPNWASLAYPIGASITQATIPADGSTVPFTLKEFYFGCGFLAGYDENLPSGCSLEVVAATSTQEFLEGRVVTYGPYTFDADFSLEYSANLTRVVLGAVAETFWFVVTAGPSVGPDTGYVFVDNVVIVNINTQGACAGT